MKGDRRVCFIFGLMLVLGLMSAGHLIAQHDPPPHGLGHKAHVAPAQVIARGAAAVHHRDQGTHFFILIII